MSTCQKNVMYMYVPRNERVKDGIKRINIGENFVFYTPSDTPPQWGTIICFSKNQNLENLPKSVIFLSINVGRVGECT